MGKAIHRNVSTSKSFTVIKQTFGEGRELHLDHDVSLKVVLKALELELQNWREVVKQHSFARILQNRHLRLMSPPFMNAIRTHTSSQVCTKHHLNKNEQAWPSHSCMCLIWQPPVLNSSQQVTTRCPGRSEFNRELGKDAVHAMGNRAHSADEYAGNMQRGWLHIVLRPLAD